MKKLKKNEKNETNLNNLYCINPIFEGNEINQTHNFYKIEKNRSKVKLNNSIAKIKNIWNSNNKNINKIKSFIKEKKSANSLYYSDKDNFLSKYKKIVKSIKIKKINNSITNIKLNKIDNKNINKKKKLILIKKKDRNNTKNSITNINSINKDKNNKIILIKIKEKFKFMRILNILSKDTKSITYEVNFNKFKWKKDIYIGNICYSKSISIHNCNKYYILKGFLWEYDIKNNLWINRGKNKIYNYFCSDIINISDNHFIILFGRNIDLDYFLEYPIYIKNNKIINYDKTKQYYYPEPRIHQFIEYSKFNKEIILIGGINKDNKILNDLWIFNILKFKWKKLNKFFYKNIEINDQITNNSGFIYDDNSDHILLLMFGGINNFMSLNNNLYKYFINKNKNKFAIKLIKTEGVRPKERINHNFIFYEKFNFGVLIGGKNDYLYEQYHDNTFNDIWILCLFNYNWIQVIHNEEGFYGASLIKNYNNSNIIIFGGYNKKGFRENLPFELKIFIK